MTDPGDLDVSRVSDGLDWRSVFFENLVKTSDVAKSAALAGVRLHKTVEALRDDATFAREWGNALDGGYAQLEWEILRRLKDGDFATASDTKYDFANAIRFLNAHRDHSAKNQPEKRIVSAAEVRASIDAKIEDLRLRVAREQVQAGPSEE